MSGGLDSPLLAAEAKAQARERGAVVCAFTYVYGRLIEDDERSFATLAASHLDIPLRLWVMDAEVGPEQRHASDIHGVCMPEPVEGVEALISETKRSREMAAESRVAFYGEGPDNALRYEWRPHLRFLRRAGRWSRIVRDVAAHVGAHHRVPLIPTIPKMLAARKKHAEWFVPFPEWLNQDLVQRLDLRQRWDEHMRSDSTTPSSLHPVRPDGYRSMNLVLWQRLFDSVDAGWSGATLDVRHPYVDLRMLRFLLSVPALPWCRTKLLLRRAGRGRLPTRTLERAKTPLSADPAFVRCRGRTALPSPAQTALLEPYVRVPSLQTTSTNSVMLFTLHSRPRDLGYWLQQLPA
jgi:asparagine synthase (glutamine-hydrolysing)